MSSLESLPTTVDTIDNLPPILQGLNKAQMFRLAGKISDMSVDTSKFELQETLNSRKDLTAEEKAQIINGFEYLKKLSLKSVGPLDTALN
jgi:hypothetical protein